MDVRLPADPLKGPLGYCDTLRMRDGQVLFRRSWPRADAGRGVLLVHGLGEHSGRYRHIANWFNARGWDVCSYDQRGHGRTQGSRGTIRATSDLLDDLAAVYAEYAAGFRAPPLLFGHSMGGLLAARLVLGGTVKPAGLVLSSPALRTHASRLLQKLAHVLAHAAPNLPLGSGLKQAYLSHDPAVNDFYGRDRFCHARITPRLAEFLFRAGPECIARAGDLYVPTLLLAGGDDHLVDVAGSRDFIAAAPASMLDAHILDGLYHEIFNEAEPARSHVFAHLASWLDAHETFETEDVLA